MTETVINNIKKYWWFFLIVALIVWYVWPKPEPKYIREEFNNGKTIEMPVDDSITSDNWECAGDCSGHEAGYSWAEDKGITDPSDCGGKSESFIEGCEAYTNEN